MPLPGRIFRRFMYPRWVRDTRFGYHYSASDFECVGGLVRLDVTIDEEIGGQLQGVFGTE